MTIGSYELKIISDSKEYDFAMELIYRGNECVLIKNSNGNEVRVPRDILEKFMDMIR